MKESNPYSNINHTSGTPAMCTYHAGKASIYVQFSLSMGMEAAGSLPAGAAGPRARAFVGATQSNLGLGRASRNEKLHQLCQLRSRDMSERRHS